MRARLNRRQRLRARFGSSLVLTTLSVLVLAAPIALAQQDERPSNWRLDPPVIEDPETPSLDVEDAPAVPAANRMWTVGVVIERFRFEGNTAIEDAELREALGPFTGRPITSDELVGARDTLTRLYIQQGYATSGAVIPDQSVRKGELTFQIVEGTLEAVEIEGANRFDADYFAARLEEAAGRPLDVQRLEELLQRFQRDPLIDKVTAQLLPGSALGKSRLTLVVEEARQEDLRFSAHNDRSPSVGEESGNVRASVANLLGRRDVVTFTGAFTEGLVDLEARFEVPLNRFDTIFEARVRATQSEIVEAPFDPLNVESDSLLVSLGLRHPVLRSRLHSVDVGLRGDWRRGRSTIDGRLFCFQPGTTDCTPTIAVVRGFAEWRYRAPRRAAALRSTLSWGTGWLGATTSPGRVPDGRFVSWLTQMQLAQRLPGDSTLIARADLQLANDPILGFERISVGGAQTVRGYRPNQLVRDNGVDASLEWQVPIWRRSLGDPYLILAPFWDVGFAWNDRFDSGDNLISSLGVGVIARPHERVEASVYWGGRLVGVDRIGTGLIDLGLHMKVLIDAW